MIILILILSIIFYLLIIFVVANYFIFREVTGGNSSRQEKCSFKQFITYIKNSRQITIYNKKLPFSLLQDYKKIEDDDFRANIFYFRSYCFVVNGIGLKFNFITWIRVKFFMLFILPNVYKQYGILKKKG